MRRLGPEFRRVPEAARDETRQHEEISAPDVGWPRTVAVAHQVRSGKLRQT
jgi:hypothetical protein